MHPPPRSFDTLIYLEVEKGYFKDGTNISQLIFVTEFCYTAA